VSYVLLSRDFFSLIDFPSINSPVLRGIVRRLAYINPIFDVHIDLPQPACDVIEPELRCLFLRPVRLHSLRLPIFALRFVSVRVLLRTLFKRIFIVFSMEIWPFRFGRLLS
jgi:hypothetical protein